MGYFDSLYGKQSPSQIADEENKKKKGYFSDLWAKDKTSKSTEKRMIDYGEDPTLIGLTPRKSLFKLVSRPAPSAFSVGDLTPNFRGAPSSEPLEIGGVKINPSTPALAHAGEMNSLRDQGGFLQKAVDTIKGIASTAIKNLMGQSQPGGQQQQPQSPIEQAINPMQPIINQKNMIDAFFKPGAFTQTQQQLHDIGVDPFSFKADPVKALKNIYSDIGKAWNTTTAEEKKRWDAMLSSKSNSERLSNVFKVEVGAANVPLGALSSLFNTAAQFPGLGIVPKALNLVLAAAGEGATVVATHFVDQLPISRGAKENLKPGIGEIAALVAQIEVGKAGDLAVKRVMLAKKYGEADATTIVQKAQEVAQQHQSDRIILKPEDARAQVEGTDLNGTDAGKIMLRAAVRAEGEKKSLQIISADEGGAYKTQTDAGVPFGIKLVESQQLRIFDNLNQNDLKLYGKDTASVGRSMFGQATTEEASKLSGNIGEETLNQVGVLAQSSKDIKIRRDARQLLFALSDRVHDGSRIDKLNKLSTSLESTGTPEGKIIEEAIKKAISEKALTPDAQTFLKTATIKTPGLDEQKVKEIASKIADQQGDTEITGNHIAEAYQLANPDYIAKLKPDNPSYARALEVLGPDALGGEKPTGDLNKIPTYDEAQGYIQKSGGYSKIADAPLPAKNQYAAEQLGQSLGLNPRYLYEESTKKGIDLYKELQAFDKQRGEKGPDVVLKAANDLMSKLNPIAESKPNSNEPVAKTEPKKDSSTENVDKTPSKIALSIERKAIEQGLTKKLENLAEYDKLTIEEQSAKAADAMKNLDEAQAIIRGEKPLPKGLHGISLITAAEEYVKKTGDSKMVYDMANSPLVSETSLAAQTMRLAAEREPDSLALKLQELKKAKLDAVKDRTGKNIRQAVADEVKDIQKHVARKAPKKQDWSDFISSIEC